MCELSFYKHFILITINGMYDKKKYFNMALTTVPNINIRDLNSFYFLLLSLCMYLSESIYSFALKLVYLYL
jgi:hypothetical protein